MASKDRSGRLPFGQLVESLREARGMDREELGRRLAISLSSVKNTENGWNYTPLRRLIRLRNIFTEGAKDLTAVWAEMKGLSKEDIPLLEAAVPSEFDSITAAHHFLWLGRLDEAESTLRVRLNALAASSSLERAEVLAALARMPSLSDAASTQFASEAAQQFVRLNDLPRAFEEVNFAAAYLTRTENYQEAEAQVRDWLCEYPEEPALWRRLGIVQWYSGQLLDALASLGMAERCGCPRSTVIHSRCQVYADLARYEDGHADAREYIEDMEHEKPTSVAYARATLGHCLGMLGDTDGAELAFAAAEHVTPNNAWLHWRWARWYNEVGRLDDALTRVERAIAATAPPLTASQRSAAMDLRAALESKS